LHEGTQKYLTERAAEWAKREERTEKGRESLKFFLARFDPQNYTKTPQPDGRVLITMQWPAELETKAKESPDKNELNMLSLTLASVARAYLSGRRSLGSEELRGFVTQVQRLANWQPSAADRTKDHYRVNSIAGGLAVLVILNRDWLAQNPELEKWCLDTLR